MDKKSVSYRQKRDESIDKNIERLKKAGVCFHYDRKKRYDYQTPPSFCQKKNNFIRVGVILVLGSGIVAWLFYSIFEKML